MSYSRHNSPPDSPLDPELILSHYNFEPGDFDPYAGQSSRIEKYAYDGPCKLDEGHRSEAIRKALTLDLPPCSAGTFPVKAEDLILYFGKDDNTLGRIDFSSSPEGDLRRLADVCDVATFGLSAHDVYDETYRKAGKLDSQYFSAKFDPVATGLLDRLRDILLVGHGEDVSIRPELYKLNVYGPGSFFRPHKDTPRGDSMFASLVIIYPTVHQGGSLLFHHGLMEHTFNSAAQLSETGGPTIAFAAFYSDVEHEVSLVDSGYRVTLTYTLHYVFTHAPRLQSFFSNTEERVLRDALAQLLADKTFLPRGGFIGFGLSHQYATTSRKTTSLSGITAMKGKDAVLMKVCKGLGIDARVQVVYEDLIDAGPVVCDRVLPSDDYYPEGYDWTHPIEKIGGRLSRRSKVLLPKINVKWITPVKAAQVKNEVETHFVAYGNEPWVGHIYGNFCLIAEIKRS